MTAALTPLPVFGVPVESKALSGPGLAAVHRADAGRHSGRHAGDRQGRRRQRRAARRRRAGARATTALADRLDALARAADRHGRRRAVRHAMKPAAARSDASASSAAASSAACWPWPRRALGYRTIILEPQADCPAAQVANRQIVAAYDDPAALAELAGSCAVVTYEFENVPVAAADAACRSRARLSAAAGAGGRAGPAGREALPQRHRHRDRRLSAPSTATPIWPRRCELSAAAAS